jgi:Fe-S-cluster containining protein
LPQVFVLNASENIKFECQKCGSCCHHKRPQEFGILVPLERLKEFWEKSNLIYLTEKDIENISRKTGLSPKEFADTLYDYSGQVVRVEDNGSKVILDFPVMRSKQDTTCVFYENGCTIYSVRPRACRLFPFRVEEKASPKEDIILSIGFNSHCPGIGKGKITAKRDLEKLVVDQFRQRSESVASEIRKLAAEGKIQKDAQVFRTFPGPKARICEARF